MNKIFLILFLVSSSFKLFGYEEILSTTDNDDNDEIYKLIVSVDEETQSLKKLYKDTYRDGVKTKRDVLNPNDLKSESGMIIEKRDKYNVLNLKSQNFDYDLGGTITIDTLYNALKGERRQVDIELAKDKNSWKLYRKNTPVSKFHIYVNKVIIIGTVGIKTIVME